MAGILISPRAESQENLSPQSISVGIRTLRVEVHPAAKRTAQAAAEAAAALNVCLVDSFDFEVRVFVPRPAAPHLQQGNNNKRKYMSNEKKELFNRQKRS